VTGNIDAYLLYKDLDEQIDKWHEEDEQENEEEQHFQL
jgi:hypothetical protein